ncbi:MAG: hypothetical protein V4556_07600 [Bacteroidota bacterium]
MDQLNEKAKKLGESISLYCKREPHLHNSKASVLEDTAWGASHLYAEVLYRAKEPAFYCINYDKLKDIQQLFQKETGQKIDIDLLLKKEWIRIVYGIVKIPSVIRSVIWEVKKASEMKAEIIFLTQVKTKDGAIGKIKFKRLVKKYEEEQNIRLDINKASTYHFLEEKEKVIKINNVSYYKPIVDYLREFQFIEYVNDYRKNKEDENNIWIEKKVLQNIISSNRKIFPKTPNLKKLTELKKIQKFGDRFILTFENDGHSTDKVGAILWSKLLDDNSFSNNRERMWFWYKRLIHGNFEWCYPGPYLEQEALKQFIETAYEIVINDSDLSFGETEYRKLKLDLDHGRLYYLEYILSGIDQTKFPISDDLFELYNGMSNLDKETQNELLYMQTVRDPLTYFIIQIVKNDSEWGNYPTVFKLLVNASTKPYILWKVCFGIYYWNPKLIPFLFLNKPTASLGFTLLWKAEISDSVGQDKNDIKLALLKSGFELVIESINAQSFSEKEKSKIIFQCLLKPFINKFKIPAGQDINRQKKEEEHTIKVAEELKSIFSNSFEPGIIHSVYGNYLNLLFPKLLFSLFKLIKEYEKANYRIYHSLSLPFAKLDLLSWLLHLRLSKEYSKQITDSDNIKYEILEEIKNIYLLSINCDEIDHWHHERKRMQKMLPSWHSYQNFDDLINWEEILLELEIENLSDDFLGPKQLVLKKASDKYDKYNRFTGEKIRTHLSILLTAYNALYNNQGSFVAKKLHVKSILNKLEVKITSYITKYCVDEPVKNRIDIFDDIFERTYWAKEKEELLPVVGYTINKFEETNKRKIIEELVKSRQLTRSLKLFEYVRSEKDREILISIINNQNITEYLDALYSVNDIQFIMQELAQSESFYEKASEALTFWEKKILTGKREDKNEYIKTAFRIKLLLAYHTGDEKKILDVPERIFKLTGASKDFSAHNEKEFYRALIFLKKKEPVKAYNIFNNRLNDSTEEKPTLALNRFASKLQWADETKKIEDKKILYTEAIEEWNEFEKKLSRNTSLQYIKEKIWYNKLHAFLKLEDNREFDAIYYQLEKTMQLRNDFLELRISNLVQRNMHLQAEKLIVEAEEYHQLSDGTFPEFINKIRAITNTENTLSLLQEQYNRIFAKSPEELIKIIPSNLNGRIKLPEFILIEITAAANDMLTYINSISKIDYEDKYSDLITLALNSRLRIYNWHVGNARGGYSDSYKPNPGEIDFAIFTRKERLTICEAMILEGKNTSVTQKHQFKVFNYDHSRKQFYMITYYKGKNDKFNSYWDGYKNDITSVIQFPEQFKIKNKILKDLSKSFGNNSIRIAKGNHDGGVTLYHVFININYKVLK